MGQPRDYVTQRGLDVVVHGEEPIHATQDHMEWSGHHRSVGAIATQDHIEQAQHNHFAIHATQDYIEVAYKTGSRPYSYAYFGYRGLSG